MMPDGKDYLEHFKLVGLFENDVNMYELIEKWFCLVNNNWYNTRLRGCNRRWMQQV